MTKWIERYRQQAEERYQRLDALLDRLQGRAHDNTGTTTTNPSTREQQDDHPDPSPRPSSRPTPTSPWCGSSASSTLPPELVYRAHVDPELVKQWMGPRSIDMDITTWDMRTGGEYRYTALRDGEEIAHFYGSIHRVWENEKIVQTFGFEEMPEAVALETLELVDLGDGRTRLEITVGRGVDGGAGRDDGQRHGGRHQRGLRRPRRASLAGLPGVGRVIPTEPAEEHRAIAGTFADRVRGVAARRLGRAEPGAGLAGARRRTPPRGVVPGVPGRRLRHQARRPDRRSTTTLSRAWEHHARGGAGRARRPGQRDRDVRPPAPAARCRSPRRSRSSTRTTSSCTPGTSPAPPGRTTGSTRSAAACCTRAWSRWTRCCGRAGSTAPRSPVPDDADWQTKLLGFIGRDPEWASGLGEFGSKGDYLCRGARYWLTACDDAAVQSGVSACTQLGRCRQRREPQGGCPKDRDAVACLPATRVVTSWRNRCPSRVLRSSSEPSRRERTCRPHCCSRRIRSIGRCP